MENVLKLVCIEMEWDCRLTKRKGKGFNWRNCKGNLALAVILVITSFLSIGETFYLDCDQIQRDGHCDCTKLDQYSIDCPINRSIYPIQLKLYNLLNPNEAFLEVTCNSQSMEQPDPIEFQWEQVQGVDLSEDKISAKIIKLSLNRCPTVPNGLKGLLGRVNISAEHVQRFTIVYTDAKTIPASYLELFPNLEILNLSQNQLEELPNLSLVPNLVELNVRSNKIKNIKSDAFRSNIKLKRVVFSHNEIELIPPSAFPSSLEYLDLSGRKLSTLTSQSLGNLHNLERLLIENAPLKNADPGCFDNLTSLKELFLKQAQFTAFPNLKNLPLLENLTINWIKVDRQPLTLSDLPGLTTLKARDSRLTDLPQFANLPNLKFVDVSKNRIQNLSREFFIQLPSLMTLDLSSNRISELVEIRSSHLVKLSLEHNQIKGLPKIAFVHLGRLEELLLSDNKIKDVDHNAFENLEELRRLDLSHNEISFSNSPFKNVPSDDLLGGFSYSFINKCTRLQHLNLSYNQFDKIFDDWKNVFTLLEELDLSYNKIRQIGLADLQFISIKNLQLNISHNEISKFNFLNSAFFDENDHSSIDIYIDGNPIICDCFAYLVKSYASKSHRLHLDELICATPPSMQNMNLLKVADKELLCELEPQKCPTDECPCWQRPVDSTILINCSNLGLESDQLPLFNWSSQTQFNKWGIAFDFSGNNIKELDAAYVSNLPERVNFIDLSRNRLESIAFMNVMKETSNLNFSLSHNPFPCDSCSDFVVIWATKLSRIVDSDNLTCLQHQDDRDVQLNGHNLSELLEDCNVTLDTAGLRILIICVVIFATLCIVMIIFMIRYSWVIKAFLFSKGWGWCLFWDGDSDDSDQEKLYDAFVSYSHKDEDWVVDELVNRLESEEGFKLCLHFRDWTPGDWIPDQIVRSVDQSKRTVVILSKNFVESVWSRLEFKAAHAQALSQGSNRVILVLIEDGLKDQDVQDEDLKVYMKMNTYLKWSDPWFWQKLKYALPHRKFHNEENPNILKKVQQREKARELDKIRTKLEQTV